MIALTVAGTAYAQQGFKFGAQFTPGSTMALQGDDFDRGEDLNFRGSFGYNMGVTLGYGFNDRFSVSTGLMYNNHVTSYVHDKTDSYEGKKFSRTLNYLRVPLWIEVGSDPTESGGFFFRIGPHFDFLLSGKYLDDRLEGVGNYDANTGIDLNREISLWEPLGGSAQITNTTAKIYNELVIGVSIQMGSQIRLTDYLKMIIMLNLETSLTNPEAEGTASFGYDTQGGVFGLSYLFSPYDAMYPTVEKSGAFHREQAWNVMGGLTFGLVYTLSTAN